MKHHDVASAATVRDEVGGNDRYTAQYRASYEEEMRRPTAAAEGDMGTVEYGAEMLRLRDEAYCQVYRDLKTRLTTRPEPTPDEFRLGTYFESLEPQVRDAIVVLNHKGYKTSNSGFALGVMQSTEGDFYIPPELYGPLAELGVRVDRWAPELGEEGAWSPLQPAQADEYQSGIRLVFRPAQANLAAIKQTWDTVASLLPIQIGARDFNLAPPDKRFYEKYLAGALTQEAMIDCVYAAASPATPQAAALVRQDNPELWAHVAPSDDFLVA